MTRTANDKLLSSAWASALLTLLTACAPDLVVGTWSCEADDAGASTDVTEPVNVPWATGFESEFCDYVRPAGLCYAAPLAEYSVLTSPVHAGAYAPAFHVRGDGGDGYQTRCVRQGVLPTAAFYGAWYFIPAPANNV